MDQQNGDDLPMLPPATTAAAPPLPAVRDWQRDLLEFAPLAVLALALSVSLLIVALALRVLAETFLVLVRVVQDRRPGARGSSRDTFVERPAPAAESWPSAGTAATPVQPQVVAVRPRRRRRLLRRVFVLGGVCTAVGLGSVAMLWSTLPDVAEFDEALATLRIQVKNDPAQPNSIDFTEPRLTLPVSAERIPQFLRDAVVAKEDKRFFSHFGIDWRGLARALVIRSGGGSTIEMQLASMLFLDRNSTGVWMYVRKVSEWLLAPSIASRYSKNEILTLYLNRVFLGGRNFGVETAARSYFRKSVEELNRYEAAMLVGIIPSPSTYFPRKPGTREHRAVERVLATMQQSKLLSAAESARVLAEGVQRGQRPLKRPYLRAFFDWIAPAIRKHLSRPGEQGFVFATIDPEIQTYAEAALRAVQERLTGRGVDGAGVLVLDPTDGSVLAMVGGFDYGHRPYNFTTKASRAAGSTFKPFVWLAALESGRWTPSSMIADEPIRIGDWEPQNHDHRFRGKLTLTAALAESRNTCAVRLQQDVGLDRVRSVARRLAPAIQLVDDGTLALGTSSVTLTDLVSAYAAFANGGHLVEPHGIISIRSLNGRGIYRRTATTVRIIDPAHVSAMNRMLEAVLDEGGTAVKGRVEGYRMAGKTGTTQNSRDAWFVGYSTHLVTGVWLGNDGESGSMEAVSGNGPPLEVWRQVMTTAHRHKHLAPALLP